MTLSKCANLLGLQVQSDVTREFPHKGTSRVNIKLSENSRKVSSSLVQQPAKQILCLVPNFYLLQLQTKPKNNFTF
jgi:hypothetical protein